MVGLCFTGLDNRVMANDNIWPTFVCYRLFDRHSFSRTGQEQGTGSGAAGLDRPRTGRDDAGERAVRGPAQGRRRAMQSYQQDQPWVGEEDTGQGHELPADGEHPKVRMATGSEIKWWMGGIGG